MVLLAFFGLPILFVVITSFKPWDAINTNALTFTPTLDNYINLLSSGLGQYDFGRYLVNSLIVSTVAVALGVIIGLPAAYSLSRLKVIDIGVFFLSFRFLPAVAVVIPVFIFFGALGLLDTYEGMILMYQVISVPYVVWMMQIYFNEVPDEIYQAAQIDGYSHFRILYRIMVPASLPGFLVTIWISFLFCWNEFFLALVLTRMVTESAPVAVSFFIGGMGRAIDWGPLTAAGVLMSLPLVVFVAVTQKYFVRAMTFGLVKLK